MQAATEPWLIEVGFLTAHSGQPGKIRYLNNTSLRTKPLFLSLYFYIFLFLQLTKKSITYIVSHITET